MGRCSCRGRRRHETQFPGILCQQYKVSDPFPGPLFWFMDSDTAESFQIAFPRKTRYELVGGEGCCYCGRWNSANRCGVKVDVWLWSCPMKLEETEICVDGNGSMRRMIDRSLEDVSCKAFLDSLIIFYQSHLTHLLNSNSSQ